MKHKKTILGKMAYGNPLSKLAMKEIKGGGEQWMRCYRKNGTAYWVYTIYTCPNPAP